MFIYPFKKIVYIVLQTYICIYIFNKRYKNYVANIIPSLLIYINFVLKVRIFFLNWHANNNWHAKQKYILSMLGPVFVNNMQTLS